MRGFASSIKASSTACSSSVSVSFIVETRDCDSTMRQQVPRSGRVSDRSASAVQVLNDIDEPRDGLDQVDRGGAQCDVAVAEPGFGDLVVTADDGIERPVEPDEQYAQFERLVTSCQAACALLVA